MVSRFLFICALIFSVAFIKDEKKTYPFEKWRAGELDSANTAKNIKTLTGEEKRVVFFTNLARENPKLFGETYAQKYIDSTNHKSSYTTSLLAQLKKGKSMSILQIDPILCSTAIDHATKFGKSGSTGHGGKKQRFDKVKGTYNVWGENCDYGSNDGLTIVMRLLIDENISNLGHRKNILDTRFTHIGTGIRPHKVYQWNCVQNFGGQLPPKTTPQ